MELERLANEYETVYAVDVECTAKTGFLASGIIDIASRRLSVDTFKEAVDKAAGFVFLG